MTLKRLLLAAAIALAVPVASAGAQPFYYQPYPAYQRPPVPQSWGYDPYTSGAAPCPQGVHGDLQSCGQKMPPSYGQPNYWSR